MLVLGNLWPWEAGLRVRIQTSIRHTVRRILALNMMRITWLGIITNGIRRRRGREERLVATLKLADQFVQRGGSCRIAMLVQRIPLRIHCNAMGYLRAPRVERLLVRVMAILTILPSLLYSLCGVVISTLITNGFTLLVWAASIGRPWLAPMPAMPIASPSTVLMIRSIRLKSIIAVAMVIPSVASSPPPRDGRTVALAGLEEG